MLRDGVAIATASEEKSPLEIAIEAVDLDLEHTVILRDWLNAAIDKLES